MTRPALRWVLVAALLAACDAFTDPATRLAYAIEAGAGHLGKDPGARHVVQHPMPSKPGECTGAYRLQVDKVGALIVWCYGKAGETVSSHSTSYHSRYADAPQTYIVDRPAGAPLSITLERRGGRASIVDIR